ncbi:hypothetical protein CEXT_712001 [Caerostris extrusa]|uniref:Uncharacterized protein n=1 Tax=Caerostris extrusa TaxID=172846 RepID=A0AAV4SBJ6_CAEEX|nr:hypothetical protein CEXT_712001 [Caerostris extrusa]
MRKAGIDICMRIMGWLGKKLVITGASGNCQSLLPRTSPTICFSEHTKEHKRDSLSVLFFSLLFACRFPLGFVLRDDLQLLLLGYTGFWKKKLIITINQNRNENYI